jgi:magnesium chelatase subunit D
MLAPSFPFTAIVGQEQMKTALLLVAVDPTIGGVLIRGERGTGKSSAARALGQLLPEIEVVDGCPYNSDPGMPFADPANSGMPQGRRRSSRCPAPFVELPLNATEDRLAGSLHIETALQQGRRRFDPGLLAAANRGMLYVDEVNLLADHLVDLLLDAAASGTNIVEREGISFRHPARFMLIGTMNPEEGELRPQFLDRFGLCVGIAAVEEPRARAEIVRRRLAFERDPEDFLKAAEESEALVRTQIRRAQALLPYVVVPGPLLEQMVSLNQDLEVQGHRADIVLLKAAAAHTALLERVEATEDDVRQTYSLAVSHRVRPPVLHAPEELQARMERAIARNLNGKVSTVLPEAQGPDASPESMAEQMQVPGSFAAGSILFEFLERKHEGRVYEPDQELAESDLAIGDPGHRGIQGGRRTRTRVKASSGRYRRAVPIRNGEARAGIAVEATLRRAAQRRSRREPGESGMPAITPQDFCRKEYEQSADCLIVFAVDASDSMGTGAEARMRAAKGAVLAILRKAHQSRRRVAFVAFSGERARVLLPPTRSIAFAQECLVSLPSGGATPFADGLRQAWHLIRTARAKDPAAEALLVVISDGEANVPLIEGTEPKEELLSLAAGMRREGLSAVFIEARAWPHPESVMPSVAQAMGAAYHTTRSLGSQPILAAVRERLSPAG